MPLIVQKYGGTSVGSISRIQEVAERVKKTVESGNKVVVVVSAMGKTTDGLVKLAQELSPHPSRREMDMLLSTGEQVSIALLTIALHALKQPAISLTGAQVGIVTEADHSRARILQIKTERLQHHLEQGKVVVVAGFQGISSSGELEITTLGRGGSDTSAVAIAASLQADACEIYTDVPGILTTDPRLVPEAQLLQGITCDEMLELASLGAKVLHPRAVEIARNYGVPLVVRSSWSQDPGTQVISPAAKLVSLEGLEITQSVDAVEYDQDQAQISLLQVPDRPGVAAQLFGELAANQVDIDLIIQSIHEGQSNDIAFTVNQCTLARATNLAEAIAAKLRNNPESSEEAQVVIDPEVAKVAITGAGMIGRPGVAAKMCQALARANVNIQMISTSEVKMSCLIAAIDLDRAITALCETFQVQSSPAKSVNSIQVPGPPVRGVALDLNQARLAIRHVPDEPGMAATIFRLLAAQNISVHMIVQSQRCRQIQGKLTRDLAFMVNETDAEAADLTLTSFIQEIPNSSISVDREVAKVSIVGAAMVGKPGVAAQFFTALAAKNINIEMITTSEIKVSCVVPKPEAEIALQLAHQAFKLGTSTPHQTGFGF